MVKKILASILLVLCVIPLFPLDRDFLPSQYIVKKINIDSTLPINTANFIFQSSDGYIWIATDIGLLRFNGFDFKLFRKNGNKPVKINTITEDGEKRIIVGTYASGLLVLEKNTLKPFNATKNITRGEISCLVNHRNGLFFGGADGLFVYKNGEINQIWPPQNGKEKDKYVLSICFKNEKILFGTDGGGKIIEFSRNNQYKIFSISNIPRELTTALLPVDNSRILTGSDISGLYFLEKGRLKKAKFKNIPQNFKVNAITKDRDGNIWIASDLGLIKLTENIGEFLNKKNGLDTDKIKFVMEDREGNIWFATKGEGIYILSQSLVKPFSSKEGLSGNIVFPVFEDKKGVLWVGTDGEGLNLIKNNRILKKLSTKNGLPNNTIRSLYLDSSNNMWIGTRSGFCYITPEGKISKTFAHGREIHDFEEDNKGILWIATTLGIIQIKNKRMLKEKDFTEWGLKSSYVCDLMNTEEGMLAATLIGGLHLIKNGKTIKIYGKKDGLSEKKLYTLFKDSGGILWLTTLNGIFFRLKNRFYPIKNRLLPDTNVLGIQEDRFGKIWFSTPTGIYYANRKDLLNSGIKNTNFKLGKLEYKDGIRNYECNGGFQPSSLKTTKGSIIFPTMKGFVEIMPNKKRKKPEPPVLHIEEITANGQSYPVKSVVNLPAGVKNLRIKFIGLNYTLPSEVVYKYKMDGIDDEWINSGKNRTAYYNILPYGYHIFSLQGGLPGGKTASLTITFSVKPKIIDLWWVKLGILMFVIFLGNIVYKVAKNTTLQYLKWRKSQKFGHFRIIKKLGSGGMGEVFLARDTRKNLDVALKLINKGFITGKERERFIKEAEIISLLNHSNIAQLYEKGEIDRRLYYSMEYIDGNTLRELMENPLNCNLALAIFKIILHVLNDLHSKGIIHRDIKPSNIMIARDGLPLKKYNGNIEEIAKKLKPFIKILDFGVAKNLTSQTLTATGLVQGTLVYQPPEILSKKTTTGEWIDFYSLGIVLYEMLTGQIPFKGKDSVEIMFSKLSEEPEPANRINPNIPFEISDFTMWLIEKNPEARLMEYCQIKEELKKIIKSGG